MGFKKRIVGSLIAAGLMAIVAMGCGSSSSGGSTTDSSAAGSTSTASESSQSEGSAEFAGKGPNAQLVKFGEEADDSEREAASSVLEENLEARAAGDWEAQCATLAGPLIKGIEKRGATLGAGAGCAKALEAQAAPVPESSRANPMTEPIAALRVEGSRGFALFHGDKGKDYVMPLLQEGSEWKVASLVTEEIP